MKAKPFFHSRENHTKQGNRFIERDQAAKILRNQRKIDRSKVVIVTRSHRKHYYMYNLDSDITL